MDYKQHDGYDKFCVPNEDGHTKLRGKAVYDTDGSLARMDTIYPQGKDRHIHEILKKRSDGSYEYLWLKDHKNH